MSDTETMHWVHRGHETTREVNQIVDARNYKGTAGYAWLIMAANPHLSGAELQEYLSINGAMRSLSWIQRRRWMFPGKTPRPKGPAADADGKQARAIQIMRDNPSVSARRLVYILKEHGIKRSRDWVWKHRCGTSVSA